MKPETLVEVHKFPFTIQKLIAEEVGALSKRLQEGKGVPGLTTPECPCKFFNRYMLPCRHIFHEELCGDARILTPEVWRDFQQTFEENGMEVYQSRESIRVLQPEPTVEEKNMETRRLAMNELFERARDHFYALEDGGLSEEAARFVERLRGAMETVLDV